jgi:VWFA-related protein
LEACVRRLLLLTLIPAVLLGVGPAAQEPAQKPSKGPEQARSSPRDTPIFRLTVSLVQLDVVVTDGKGRHVTTLGPEDFEVYQDGRRQPVTAVSYVDNAEVWEDTSGLPPLPPEALRPRDARRAMAIVVDDLRMSFESIYYSRRGLQRFLEREFQQGDLAMLVTTTGLYRPELTFSPKVLRSAVNRLRFSLWDIRPASILDPIDIGGRAGSGFDPYDRFQQRNFAQDSMAKIDASIDLLKPLPGRKSVILLSEGFTIFGPGLDNALMRDLMQRLVDHANRAGVVVYALDPRGLVYTGLTAADGAGGGVGPMGRDIGSMRSAALRESQDGLRYLANETGGFAVVDNNDLAGGMKRIMVDQQGYYLIGYQPEAGTLAPDSTGKFRHIKIKVTRKGLKVRTRSGFYAVASE